MTALAVYCADVGSIKRANFGWARATNDEDMSSSESISSLVDSVAKDLEGGQRVALGFECPLYVPVSDDPNHLTSQRLVDQGRPWSASAGAVVLAIGLTETVWILQKIRDRIESPRPAFLNWREFSKAEPGLFLWEAMVTGKAKGASHRDDAVVAVRTFRAMASRFEVGKAEEEARVYSLIGAALLRTGWSDDLSLLSQPCLVVKP